MTNASTGAGPIRTDTAATVLARALKLGAIVAAAIALVAAAIGFLADGTEGLVSGIVGAAFALVFLGITAASIIVAGRLMGGPAGPAAFFGVVLGGWLVKVVVFFAAMFLLRGQPWVSPVVLFLAIVATVLGSLIVDVVVVSRARIPVTER